MATIEQRNFFREMVGDTGTPSAFADDEIDGYYAEIALLYPSATTQESGARVILRAIPILLVNASKLTSYKQNQSSENLDQIFENLKDLYTLWSNILGTELALNASVNAGWGALGGGNPRRGFGRPLNEPLYGDLSRNRRIW